MTTLVVLVGAALLLISRGIPVADTLVCLSALCALAAAMTVTTTVSPGEAQPAAVDVLHALLSGDPTGVTEAWT